MDFLFYQNSIYFLIFLLVAGGLLLYPLLRQQGKGNTGLTVKEAGTLPRNKPLILVCDNGREAAKMAGVLRGKNTENVYTLAGGMGAWKADGMPVKQHA